MPGHGLPIAAAASVALAASRLYLDVPYKDKKATLETMHVDHGQAAQIGAFKKDALSLNDVLTSADDLNLNGEHIGTKPEPKPKKSNRKKKPKLDTGRGIN